MKIGLIGYACATGLGELNRQITTYCDIAQWLIVPHPKFGIDDSLIKTSRVVGQAATEHFVRSVDVVLFCEQSYYSQVIPLCKRYGKRIICIPMIEWTPVDKWTKDVDLFICPTLQCYTLLSAEKLKCTYFPWPIDTERFKFQRREICNSFLFCNGNGGWKGRKGSGVVRAMCEEWPQAPLCVRSQKRELWPKNVRLLPTAKQNYELYSEGDVLISPHSVDGIGLEILEAAACGIPVISTYGDPWNDYPALDRIPSLIKTHRIMRDINWYTPLSKELVAFCKKWQGKSIREQSLAVRKWAELRSWAESASSFISLVRG